MTTTYSKTIESAGKRRKRYVDHPKGTLKLTCIINGPGYSSNKCNVLGDFGTKYNKEKPTKYHMQEHSTKKSFGRHQDKNTIVKHKFDKIIPQDNKKLIVKYESQENIDDEGNEDDLYDLDKMSLDEKEWRKHAFESELEYIYDIKR